MSWILSPMKYLTLNPWYLWTWSYWKIRPLLINLFKVRSLEWALVQHDWCLCRRRECHVELQTHKENVMWPSRLSLQWYSKKPRNTKDGQGSQKLERGKERFFPTSFRASVTLWILSNESDASKLWCWRRLLRVPCMGRRSNQSIIKAINPD